MGGKPPKSSVSTSSPYAPWLKGHLMELVEAGADYTYGGRGGEPFGFSNFNEETGNFVSDEYLQKVDPRFADFDPYQLEAQQATARMYDQGDRFSAESLGAANSAMGGLSNMQAVSSGYVPTSFEGGQFDQAAADQYMNPYMQSVVDSQSRAARDEYARQEMGTDAERVASGSRGGYREAVDQAVGRAQQGQVMADIQGRGSEAAYRDAQQMFDRDRTSRLEAEGMSDQSLFRADEQQMRAALENQSNTLRQAQARSEMSKLYSDLDQQTQARENSRINQLSAAGNERYQIEQSRRDLAFDEYMREFEYPKEMMRFMSGIMSGVPTQANAYVRTPGPNLLQSGIGAATALGGAALAAKG
jgi:hypothetical protein